MKKIINMVIVAIYIAACSPQHSHDNHEEAEGGSHSHETNEIESITVFSENYEAFVEFTLLEVGQEAEFLIHITDLESYTGIEAESLRCFLKVNDYKQEAHVHVSNTKGIYHAHLMPENAGLGEIHFEIIHENKHDVLVEDHVHVYKHGDVIHQHNESESGTVSFLKEQAWSSPFMVEKVRLDSFPQIITASGEFLPMPGEKQSVIAKSKGFVHFETRNMVQGNYVVQGNVLFTLKTMGLIDDNISLRYKDAQISLKESRSVYQRHQSLFAEKIISEKTYQESESKYVKDSLYFISLSQNFSQEGQKVKAPLSGYIHELNVSEGQYVDEGVTLATISTNKVLLLKADVPQQYFQSLHKIYSTHFRPSYSNRVYTLEEMNGKLISHAASVAENNHYMPVFFELENDGSLLEGAFAEFYLHVEAKTKTIIIPLSAVLEEQGRHYAYVQLAGEKYQKRLIQTGQDNGIYVSVESGLSENDRIVTMGAILLRTMNSASIPVHNHEH